MMELIQKPSNVYLKNKYEYGLKLIPPFTAIISGCSKSGKSSLLRSILLEEIIFSDNENILYFYGEWDEKNYQVLKTKLGKRISFLKGLSSENQEVIHTIKSTVIIFDDLASIVFKNSIVRDLYTKGSHHRLLTVIILSQSLFPKEIYAREIAINTTYNILFDTPRDRTTVNYLSRQAFPGDDALIKVYKDYLQAQPYRYIVIDWNVFTQNKFRIWTGILKSERAILFYSHENETIIKKRETEDIVTVLR